MSLRNYTRRVSSQSLNVWQEGLDPPVYATPQQLAPLHTALYLNTLAFIANHKRTPYQQVLRKAQANAGLYALGQTQYGKAVPLGQQRRTPCPPLVSVSYLFIHTLGLLRWGLLLGNPHTKGRFYYGNDVGHSGLHIPQYPRSTFPSLKCTWLGKWEKSWDWPHHPGEGEWLIVLKMKNASQRAQQRFKSKVGKFPFLSHVSIAWIWSGVL